jgi:hypothetical protein
MAPGMTAAGAWASVQQPMVDRALHARGLRDTARALRVSPTTVPDMGQEHARHNRHTLHAVCARRPLRALFPLAGYDYKL